ncbi:MAG: hypothetical protein QXV17_07570 [Candidatus Micrarchaeaceae archaeon]
MNAYKYFKSLWADASLRNTRAVIPNEARPTFYATRGIEQFSCGNIENTVFQVPITYQQIATVNNFNVQTQGGISISEATIIQPAFYWQSGSAI